MWDVPFHRFDWRQDGSIWGRAKHSEVFNNWAVFAAAPTRSSSIGPPTITFSSLNAPPPYSNRTPVGEEYTSLLVSMPSSFTTKGGCVSLPTTRLLETLIFANGTTFGTAIPSSGTRGLKASETSFVPNGSWACTADCRPVNNREQNAPNTKDKRAITNVCRKVISPSLLLFPE